MQYYTITKEIKKGLGTPLPDIIDLIQTKLPKDIKEMMALGVNFDIKVMPNNGGMTINLKSRKKISVLKDKDGAIISIVSEKGEVDNI